MQLVVCVYHMSNNHADDLTDKEKHACQDWTWKGLSLCQPLSSILDHLPWSSTVPQKFCDPVMTSFVIHVFIKNACQAGSEGPTFCVQLPSAITMAAAEIMDQQDSIKSFMQLSLLCLCLHNFKHKMHARQAHQAQLKMYRDSQLSPASLDKVLIIWGERGGQTGHFVQQNAIELDGMICWGIAQNMWWQSSAGSCIQVTNTKDFCLSLHVFCSPLLGLKKDMKFR